MSGCKRRRTSALAASNSSELSHATKTREWKESKRAANCKPKQSMESRQRMKLDEYLTDKEQDGASLRAEKGWDQD